MSILRFLRALPAWLQFGNLRSYPELRSVPREEAPRRLKLAWRADPVTRLLRIGTLAVAGCVTCVCALTVLGFRHPGVHFIVFGLNASGFTALVIMMRRIRRRVRVTLEADMKAGRALECLECGYDLRVTAASRCPECGAAVTTVPSREAFSDPQPEPRVRRTGSGMPPKGFEQWR